MARSGIDDASENLEQLVERALAGEQVVIEANSDAALELVPVTPVGGIASLRGAWKDKVQLEDDFDELPGDFGREFGIE